MERRICEAAIEGNVISLLNLLQEDALVLDRFTVGCYSETPLHIASMLGHLEFVQEILNRKPDLAGELDARISSPLHLAAAKGNLDIVKVLVSVNPEMCFARDGDGRNPLHIATVKGRISVLRELVNVRPQAARILTDRGETILHLCVRYCQLETLKFLVETIVDDDGSLHSKCDDDGNTILHIAAADKQVKAIEFLTTNTATEVNALNVYGFTALDISTQLSRKHVEDWEIAGLLQRSGAMHAHELGTAQMARTLTRHGNHPTNTLQPQNRVSGNVHENVMHDDWFEKMRTALMVVASLIATMAFQVAINPPGGVWQEDSPKGTDAPAPRAHKAGLSIFADNDPTAYAKFLAYNTTSFVASLSIILLLISGVSIRRKLFMWILMVIMWIAVTAVAFTYMVSIFYVTELEASYHAAFIAQLVWVGLIGIILLRHIIRLIVKMVKYVRKSIIRLRRQPSSSTIA